MPTTLEELLEKSKQCHNYNKYAPSDWEYLARYLSYVMDVGSAYAILDSKHMRYCEDRTFEGFLKYLDDDKLTLDDIGELRLAY